MPNTLLASADEEDRRLLMPHLSSVSLFKNDVLEEPGQPIEFAYFLEDGVAMLAVASADHRPAGVALIGPEAMSAVALLLGADRSVFRCVVKRHGPALRVEAAVLRRLLATSPRLHRHLLGAARALAVQLADTAFFNLRCTVLQRVARWLFLAGERSGGNELPLTHEDLAVLLGVRRASVASALNALEASRAIASHRASIRILDRAGLLERATPAGYRVAERSGRACA